MTSPDVSDIDSSMPEYANSPTSPGSGSELPEYADAIELDSNSFMSRPTPSCKKQKCKTSPVRIPSADSSKVPNSTAEEHSGSELYSPSTLSEANCGGRAARKAQSKRCMSPLTRRLLYSCILVLLSLLGTTIGISFLVLHLSKKDVRWFHESTEPKTPYPETGMIGSNILLVDDHNNFFVDDGKYTLPVAVSGLFLEESGLLTVDAAKLGDEEPVRFMHQGEQLQPIDVVSLYKDSNGVLTQNQGPLAYNKQHTLIDGEETLASNEDTSTLTRVLLNI